MIIWSIVIIINSVLTLQVSTASLPHDREPCEKKVVSNHTCLLHTCVCAGSRRVRVRLSGFRRQEISSTPGGLLKCPFPVRVCAEHPINCRGLLKISRKMAHKVICPKQKIISQIFKISGALVFLCPFATNCPQFYLFIVFFFIFLLF